MDSRIEITALLREALARTVPEAADAEIVLERPREAAHGDFACNLALQLARRLKKNPRQLAAVADHGSRAALRYRRRHRIHGGVAGRHRMRAD